MFDSQNKSRTKINFSSLLENQILNIFYIRVHCLEHYDFFTLIRKKKSFSACTKT